MHLNLFDIIILAVFFGSVMLGMYRGLIVSSINIGNFILTIFLTIILTPLAEEIVEEHLKNQLFSTIISVIIAYLLSNFASNWLSKRLKEMVENYSHNFIDRTLGLWIGALRGYVICIGIFIGIGAITSSSYVGAQNYWQIIHNISPKEYPNWLKNASLYSIMNGSFNIAYNAISDGFVQKYLENLDMPSKQIENSVPTQREEVSEQKKENPLDSLQEELQQTL